MADDDDEQIVEIVSSRVLGSSWLGSARLWLGLSQFIAQLCFVLGTKNNLLFLFRI